MEPSSLSGESIRSIKTYATAANHPMTAILKACRVVLLCGLFGVCRSHDRCTPFIAETNRATVTTKNTEKFIGTYRYYMSVQEILEVRHSQFEILTDNLLLWF